MTDYDDFNDYATVLSDLFYTGYHKIQTIICVLYPLISSIRLGYTGCQLETQLGH